MGLAGARVTGVWKACGRALSAERGREQVLARAPVTKVVEVRRTVSMAVGAR